MVPQYFSEEINRSLPEVLRGYEKRRDRMREVVRQELGGDLKTLGQFFMFTNQPQPPDPKHMWLNPCWYFSYDEKPVAIL
jgi:hypothetical protein